MIKGNKYGLQIVLDPELSFDELLLHVTDKFHKSRGFFDKNRPIAVGFSGRELTDQQQNQLVDTIMDAAQLQITYIIDGAKAIETAYADAIAQAELDKNPSMESETEGDSLEEDFLEEAFHADQKTEKNGQFYRGTLRSGQSIEVDGSIVILGDINPGAQVIAGGNVVVLGCLKGMISAGFPSDQSAVVAALMMEPMQIKIGNIIARAPDQKVMARPKKRFRKKQVEMEPKLAFVEKENIIIEPITRSLVNEFASR